MESTFNVEEAVPNAPNVTQGIYRSTLQLMIGCNDQTLKDHFAHAEKRATYISPVIQNQLIDSIRICIQENIVNDLSKTKFFSVIADESTDFARQEQLTVCIRYLNSQDEICERFLCFAVAPDLTGKGLSDQLMKILTDMDIDTTFMIGQGYDGAAAMSGEFNGVQKHIGDMCPKAIYVHCASHTLNLCLIKSSEITTIKACISMMHCIAVFYTDSNKCLAELQKAIQEVCPDSKHTRLKKHCETRWVEKQVAVHVFKDLYPAVVLSLEHISQWRDNGNGSGQAAVFLRAFDSEFHVTLQVLNIILEVSHLAMSTSSL